MKSEVRAWEVEVKVVECQNPRNKNSVSIDREDVLAQDHANPYCQLS